MRVERVLIIVGVLVAVAAAVGVIRTLLSRRVDESRVGLGSVRTASGAGARDQTAADEPAPADHDEPTDSIPAASERWIKVTRASLGLLGLAAIGFGVWSLRDFSIDQLVSLVFWLGGGVVLHDGVLAPLVVALCVLLARVLPKRARVPATVALVVWGTVTVMAFAVLSGKGGHPDNPTLLDRDYRLSWLIGTVLVAAAVVLWSRVGVSRDSNRRSD